MMIRTIIFLFLGLGMLCSGCKKDPDPVSKRIAKEWIVSIARENGTVVYDKTKSTHTNPGYASFALNLSSADRVVLTDVDNIAFTGKWEMKTDTELTISQLNPAPTGTNGSIFFTVSNFSDIAMTLTRTTANLKTGGTVNAYDMVSK